LNGIRVDDSGEIHHGHAVAVKLVAGLLNTAFTVGTENLVEALESISSVDNEATEVTSGSELEQVKAVNIAGVDTGQVLGSALNLVVLITVDDKGTTGVGETRSSHLTSTATVMLQGGFSEGSGGTNSFERLKESLGSVNVEAVNNKGQFGDGVNVVSTGKHEGSASRGSQSGGNGVTLLVGVHLAVPLAPCAEGSEHATLTALITESSLSGTVSTGTTNTGNTGNSATSTPGFSGVLMTLGHNDTMGLTLVLGHVHVAELNDIVTDGSGEDIGHLNLSGDSAVFGVDGHERAGGHFVVLQI
jgi:hypothetical protein